jgi:hypothetical protein
MGGDIEEVNSKINNIIVKTILAVYEKMTFKEKIKHNKKESFTNKKPQATH